MSILPEPLHQPYVDLRQMLDAMQAIAQPALMAPSSLHTSALQKSFQAIQQHFQQQILATSAELELPSLVQSVQTEINRNLRLLSTDVAFLQSARQVATQQQRLQQVCDRLTKLLEFCDGVLQG
ncbi:MULTISPECIES: heterocyst frequency control protein PatD [unclassified Leptolyngbya]|uniref:heterocyst frequency control protein PatD n=1 Tax=unclassified Leptolyngbya TaxID=2650499 RepID=UPI0016893E09|nr:MULTISPECIES: heterocyst frequency control protein PatD [unclassified Leptolyngbya]MBD1913438.1 heterocyst frequency control protein PatD [Leptolyngbya sp. FACHB-8]MBD2155833.1 heterocyst frequency control protein PatD [Leptolyngbya sp. FACHB-16]